MKIVIIAVLLITAITLILYASSFFDEKPQNRTEPGPNTSVDIPFDFVLNFTNSTYDGLIINRWITEFSGVARDATLCEDGVIIVGTKSPSTTIESTNDRLMVTKINSNNQVEWNFWLEPPTRAIGITQNHDGGYVIVGTKNDTLYLFKIDEEGKILWEREYNGAEYTIIHKIMKAPDSIYVWIELSRNHSLLSLDLAGDIRWHKRIQKPLDMDHALFDVEQIPHQGDEGEPPTEGFVFLLSQNNKPRLRAYDQNGNSIWNRTILWPGMVPLYLYTTWNGQYLISSTAWVPGARERDGPHQAWYTVLIDAQGDMIGWRFYTLVFSATNLDDTTLVLGGQAGNNYLVTEIDTEGRWHPYYWDIHSNIIWSKKLPQSIIPSQYRKDMRIGAARKEHPYNLYYIFGSVNNKFCVLEIIRPPKIDLLFDLSETIIEVMENQNFPTENLTAKHLEATSNWEQHKYKEARRDIETLFDQVFTIASTILEEAEKDHISTDTLKNNLGKAQNAWDKTDYKNAIRFLEAFFESPKLSRMR